MKEIVRIGGEAKLSNGFFVVTAPIRGFEKMVEGKSPLFVIEAVMRICGICHTAHAIASCEAFEHAFGIFPPRNGLLLREAAGLLNRIQSHLIHNIMILPDMVQKEDELIDASIELLEKINNIMAGLVGSSIHPNKIVIGGISKPPSEKIIENSKRLLEEAYEIYKEIRDIELDESKWRREAINLKNKEIAENFLASHLFYGDRYAINVEEIEVIRHERENNAMLAKYNGRFTEVGPRARLKIYRDFSYNGIIGIQVARIKEIDISFKRIKEILKNLDPSQPFKTEGFIFRKGEGIGVYEAPRGLLIHKAELNDEGRVEKYQIIVPTMFNIPHMENTGNELIIRLYDPCIPCATHFVEVIE